MGWDSSSEACIDLLTMAETPSSVGARSAELRALLCGGFRSDNRSSCVQGQCCLWDFQRCVSDAALGHLAQINPPVGCVWKPLSAVGEAGSVLLGAWGGNGRGGGGGARRD